GPKRGQTTDLFGARFVVKFEKREILTGPLGGDMRKKIEPDCDPYAYVISANIHRRHLSVEQKRDLIAKLIKATPGKSDRQIGEMIKADHKTVGAVRAHAEATGEISPVEKRVGKDGKSRKQPAKRQIAPLRQAFGDQARRGFQLAKVERYTRGNVSAEEKRDE